MSEKTLSQIIDLLKEKNISYEHIHHETITRTSADASLVRGTELEEGAKALILETKSKQIIQIVIPAHLKASFKKVKRMVGEKNVSLADPQKVQKITDCVVGSVPPFGVLWNIPVYIDPLLLENERIVFSSGTLEDSIFIESKELVSLNDAKVIDIIKEEAA